MTDISFDDLTDSAGEAAEEAATQSANTGEWVRETVELLDKRGLLEPMLFGPDGAQELQEQHEQSNGADVDDGDDVGLDADTIAAAGESIMEQLGEDVTVAEVVQICEDNPKLVDQKIGENL